MSLHNDMCRNRCTPFLLLGEALNDPDLATRIPHPDRPANSPPIIIRLICRKRSGSRCRVPRKLRHGAYKFQRFSHAGKKHGPCHAQPQASYAHLATAFVVATIGAQAWLPAQRGRPPVSGIFPVIALCSRAPAHEALLFPPFFKRQHSAPTSLPFSKEQAVHHTENTSALMANNAWQSNSYTATALAHPYWILRGVCDNSDNKSQCNYFQYRHRKEDHEYKPHGTQESCRCPHESIPPHPKPCHFQHTVQPVCPNRDPAEKTGPYAALPYSMARNEKYLEMLLPLRSWHREGRPPVQKPAPIPQAIC